MKEYIYALAGTAVVGELFLMLMPEGAMKPFAKTAVGMLVMLMLLLPLRKCTYGERIFFTETQESAHKASYSDIIMDIYNSAMQEGSADG